MSKSFCQRHSSVRGGHGLFSCASFYSRAGGWAEGEEGVMSPRKRPAEHNSPQQTSSHTARQPDDNNTACFSLIQVRLFPKSFSELFLPALNGRWGKCAYQDVSVAGLVIVKSGAPWWWRAAAITADIKELAQRKHSLEWAQDTHTRWAQDTSPHYQGWSWAGIHLVSVVL